MTIKLLDGVRVLEVAHLAAGPMATRILADLGATVYKVEGPHGDVGRTLGSLGSNTSAMYEYCNRGKQSVGINLGHADGKALLFDLVAQCDVFITNFRPQFIKRIGLDWEHLRPINPGLIAVYVTGHGMTDPRSDMPSGDVVAQAESGIAHFTGEADGGPLYNPGAVADSAGATYAAVAMLAALAGRKQPPEGQMIDLAILDTYMAMDLLNTPSVAATHGAFDPGRPGRLNANIFPHGVFPAGKGEFVMISAYGAGAQGHWPRLARVMGRPDLAEDPGLDSDAQRLARKDELLPLLEGWLTSFATADEAVAKMREADVVAGRVMPPLDAVNSPRAQARGMVQEIQHPAVGAIGMIGLPMLINGAHAQIQPAPALAAHTREALSAVLGLSAERLDALKAAGAIFDEPA